MKVTYQILIKHIIIGGLVTLFIFYIINELPYFSVIKENIVNALAVALILALTIWIASSKINKLLIDKNANFYLISIIFILFVWILLFISSALYEGLESSLRNKRFEIVEATEGWIIYRLWIYTGVGMIHGFIGGIFLAIELKKKLKIE